MTNIAWYVNIWQEMHFNFKNTITFTCVATSTFDVKGEATSFITTFTRSRNAGKEFANGCEKASVGSRVGARCATNRRLIHEHNVAEVLRSVNPPAAHLAVGLLEGPDRGLQLAGAAVVLVSLLALDTASAPSPMPAVPPH